MTIGQVNSDLSWAPLVNGRFDLPSVLRADDPDMQSKFAGGGLVSLTLAK
jgi:hypothetical protein